MDPLAKYLDTELKLQQKGKFVIGKVDLLLKIASMHADASSLLYEAGALHKIWGIPPESYKTFANAFCQAFEQSYPKATSELQEAWSAVIMSAAFKMSVSWNYKKGEVYSLMMIKKKKWTSCRVLVELDHMLIGKRKKKLSFKTDWLVEDITDPNIPEKDWSFMMADSGKVFYLACNTKKEMLELRSKIVVSFFFLLSSPLLTIDRNDVQLSNCYTM